MFLENTKVFKWKSLFLLNSFQNKETIFEKEINGFYGDDFNFEKTEKFRTCLVAVFENCSRKQFLVFSKKKKNCVW